MLEDLPMSAAVLKEVPNHMDTHRDIATLAR